MANVKKENDMVKSRLVVLARMFYSLTDEEHQMTNTEILEYLKEHDAPANEKTLRGDIRLLKELGVDIVTIVSRPNRYYQGKREFSVPELKLLIDAVSSSRFITQKKSRELGKKLSELASVNQRGELRRYIYATNRVKASNEEIYYTVDAINRAITKRKKIAFKYVEYDVDKKKQFKHDGEMYELSPYALLWNEDFYYVVGYSEKHQNVSVFRVDRMYKPEVMKDKAVKRPDDFDLYDYTNRMFDMYAGEHSEVKLECRGDLMKYVIDRFGENVPVERVESNASAEPERFIATVNVELSPPFYAWVFQFGGEVRILSPRKAVDDIIIMANTLLTREQV